MCGSIEVPPDSSLARLRTAGTLFFNDDNDPGPESGLTVPGLQKSQKDAAMAKADARSHQKQSRKAINKLLEAARSGDYRSTVDQVAEGVDVHVCTLRGQTALMLAAGSSSKGTLETVKFLLDAAASVEEKDKAGWTALHHACRNSQQEVVDLLLERQASIKARAIDGKTVVMMAAMDMSDSLVMHLIAKHAALEKKDERGWPVLFYACEDGRLDLVRWLLKKSASPKEKAKDGTTALMVVAEQGNRNIGKRLLKAKAGLNARTNSGNSSLMIALRAMRVEFAEWLVEEGADVSFRNMDDEDAIEIADSMGMTATRNKLEQKARLLEAESEDADHRDRVGDI